MENIGSNTYQSLAMRTFDHMADVRMNKEIKIENPGCSDNGLKPDMIPTLINGILGLTGEAGEVSDMVKKGIFHEEGIDLLHLKKEVGDVCWYIALICEACGFDLSDVMKMNIEKLKKRYPEGFDPEKSLHRAAGDI